MYFTPAVCVTRHPERPPYVIWSSQRLNWEIWTDYTHVYLLRPAPLDRLRALRPEATDRADSELFHRFADISMRARRAARRRDRGFPRPAE